MPHDPEKDPELGLIGLLILLGALLTLGVFVWMMLRGVG